MKIHWSFSISFTLFCSFFPLIFLSVYIPVVRILVLTSFEIEITYNNNNKCFGNKQTVLSINIERMYIRFWGKERGKRNWKYCAWQSVKTYTKVYNECNFYVITASHDAFINVFRNIYDKSFSFRERDYSAEEYKRLYYYNSSCVLFCFLLRWKITY